jgi:putative FmdB family regulatory protein
MQYILQKETSMPIYEYLCASCGAKNEKIQSQPLEQVTCPDCGQKANRIVSMTSAAGNDAAGSCSAPSSSGFG